MFGKTSLVERELKGFGRVKLPSRLEGPVNESSEKGFLFSFRRYYPWYDFSAMGSGTPLREELAIQIAPVAPAKIMSTWAAGRAADTVKPTGSPTASNLTWRSEPPFQVAEGIYTMNVLRDPVVALVLPVPALNAVIGYRAWRKDVSMDQAKRLLLEIAASLTASAPLPQLFVSEKTRPEREYHEKLAAIRAGLAKHGLELPESGGLREQNGFLIFFTDDAGQDGSVTIVKKVGELRLPGPVSDRNPDWKFEYPSGTRPKFLYPLGWYINVKGEWKWGGQNGIDPPPPLIDQRARALLIDPAVVHFYVIREVNSIRRQPLDSVEPAWWITLLPETAKRLNEGKIVRFN